MGDRANVKIEMDGGSVFLYTHCLGTELPYIIQRVIARQARWNDGPYLARMIFSEMIKGHESSETGFGISPQRADYDHPDIIVNCNENIITIQKRRWTFNQYILATDIQN